MSVHLQGVFMNSSNTGANLLQGEPTLVPASLEDYPIIQNMARLYVYDLSRSCGFISKDWALPETGLYESFDFKNYFVEDSRRAYFIKVGDELAGFVLLNRVCIDSYSDWNMGEFFILAKFQGIGVGTAIAQMLFTLLPGTWEVSVIPQNSAAIAFWEKAISRHTRGDFSRKTKRITFDPDQPLRIVFSFK
jgi:predicted acetyltransferase